MKWNTFLSSYINKIIDKAHSKVIELYIERSKVKSQNLEEIHIIDSQIESWKWTVEFNRDRQRLDRYPMMIILSSLCSGIVASLITLFLFGN